MNAEEASEELEKIRDLLSAEGIVLGKYESVLLGVKDLAEDRNKLVKLEGSQRKILEELRDLSL